MQGSGSDYQATLSTGGGPLQVTGIAGPGGATPDKPVGRVVFARARRGADPTEVVADSQDFGDLGRDEVRRQAVIVALELLMPGDGKAAAAP